MNPKTLLCGATAVAAVLLSIAFTTPARAQGKPALTRDIDRPTAQPVNGNCFVAFPSTTIAKCALYTVPAGKRLVVEMVGYEVATGGGTPFYQLLFGQDTGTADLSVTSPNVYDVNPTLTFEQPNVRAFSGTQMIKIYLDENKTLAA